MDGSGDSNAASLLGQRRSRRQQTNPAPQPPPAPRTAVNNGPAYPSSDEDVPYEADDPDDPLDPPDQMSDNRTYQDEEASVNLALGSATQSPGHHSPTTDVITIGGGIGLHCLTEQEARLSSARARHRDKLMEMEKDIGKKINFGASNPLYTSAGAQAQHTDGSGVLSMLRLIDYCDNTSQTKRGFLDDLLKIMREEISDRGFSVVEAKSSDTIRRDMKRRYGAGLLPLCKPVRLLGAINNRTLVRPDDFHNRRRELVNCYAFDMRAGLLDLLGDREIFGNLDNLVVNENDPFAPYENPHPNHQDEFLDGTWYRDTIRRLSTSCEYPFDAELEFLVPLVVYLDKTGTDAIQRYPLEPVSFTTALIRRKLRNHDRAWRYAGLIPDLESKSKAEKDRLRSTNPSASAYNYHLCLQAALTDSLKTIQDEGILYMLRLGNEVKSVRLRPQLMCITNDGKSGDMICTRTEAKTNAVRVSWCCNAPQRYATRVPMMCKFVEYSDKLHSHEFDEKGEEIERLTYTMSLTVEQCYHLMESSNEEVAERMVQEQDPDGEPTSIKDMIPLAEQRIAQAKQDLKAAGFKTCMNAFISSGIQFGLDPRGVFGCNPTDPMHAFQSGIVLYLVKMVLDPLSTARRVQLDCLVDKILATLRQKEKENDYPRLTFSKGFCKATMIHSNEWVGKLFVLLILARHPDGKKALSNSFSDKPIKIDFPECSDVTDRSIQLQREAQRLDQEALQERNRQELQEQANKRNSRQASTGNHLNCGVSGGENDNASEEENSGEEEEEEGGEAEAEEELEQTGTQNKNKRKQTKGGRVKKGKKKKSQRRKRNHPCENAVTVTLWSSLRLSLAFILGTDDPGIPVCPRRKSRLYSRVCAICLPCSIITCPVPVARSGNFPKHTISSTLPITTKPMARLRTTTAGGGRRGSKLGPNYQPRHHRPGDMILSPSRSRIGSLSRCGSERPAW